jgi:hypothetical protein
MIEYKGRLKNKRPFVYEAQLVMYKYRYVILWSLFILFACGANPGTLAKLRLEDLFGYDKPIHAFLFGMQAWLWIIASPKPITQNKLLLICLACAGYGAGIEFMQKWFFVGRTYDYFDMTANILGCVIVYFVSIKKGKHV